MADELGQAREQAPEAALMLVDGGDRRWGAAPADVLVGAVRVVSWQVHQLPVPGSFAGNDGYLVKLNYELALEPEVAPPWFEVGFELADASTGDAVPVLDALPRAVGEPSGPAGYSVTGYLGFAPAPDAATVALPALSPVIDVFGIGGQGPVRWRHQVPGTAGEPGGLRPGSHSCWLITLVPAGCSELDARLLARYDLDPDAALGCLPGTGVGGFRIALREATSSPVAGAVPGDSAAMAPGVSGRPPRVFISYAHDDDWHVESVRAFAEFLVAGCGLDVHLDRWDTGQRRDWYLWAAEQVRLADYVLVVASPMCRAVADGEVRGGRHRGLQSEMGILRELLNSDRVTWTGRLLPVVLPGGSVDDIPRVLQPWTADHYLVADLTVAGVKDLLRVITWQPPFARPPLAARLALPPRPPAWLPPAP